MRFLASRIRTSVPSLRKPTLRRTLYSRQAEFITFGPRGSLVTRKVAVGWGIPHEAFTMVLFFRYGKVGKVGKVLVG